MRKPLDTDVVICPASGEKLRPLACWDSSIGQGKSKRKIAFGIMALHHHANQECEWSGMVVQVEAKAQEVPM